jgi:hypothetical protein
MRRASQWLKLAAGVILASPWLACGELPAQLHLRAASAAGSLLLQAQRTSTQFSTGPSSTGFNWAVFAFPLTLFLAMGYIWQALDEEEFPDHELPQWFVRLFRGRHRAAPSRQA